MTAEEYFEQGHRYYEKGEYENAIKCYDKVIGLTPTYHTAYENRTCANKKIIERLNGLIKQDEATIHKLIGVRGCE